ncbi:MAG TPA: hypothetical protein PLZ28_06025 [Clostridia bacterium]|nr:hypothetical protein [Clostridia bacterium]
MKRLSNKNILLFAMIVMLVLLLTACAKQELPKETVSSEVTTPPAEVVEDFVLIAELSPTDKYLSPILCGVKVYGKNKDNYGNYTEIKFVFKDKEWISDELKFFPQLELRREDECRMYLPTLENRDFISVIYGERDNEDTIRENIIFFDWQTFTQIKPEELNILIVHKQSTDVVVSDDKSYTVTVAEKSKNDRGIFDEKKNIMKYNYGEVNVFALRKDKMGNYYDLYARIKNTGKNIKIPDRKQYEYGGPRASLLDLNGDGNDELILVFWERNPEGVLTQSVCFMDIKAEKEVSLSDLGLENIVEVTYQKEKRTIAHVDGVYKEYDVVACHHKRKGDYNKDNLKTIPTEEIKRISGDIDLALSLLTDPILFITEKKRPDIFVLQYCEKIELYHDWSMPMPFPKYNNGKEEITYESSVQMGLIDLDNDGIKEIVITMWVGKGTGYSATDLHIIDSTTMEEIVTLTNDDIAILISSYIDAKIVTKEEQVIINICVNNDPDNTYTHTVKRNENITYFETPSFTQSVGFTIDEINNKVTVGAGMMIAAPWYAGSFNADITVVDGKVQLTNIHFSFD